MEPLLEHDPKMVGQFTIIGRLGEGGMGTVYLASQGTRSVALKVIHPSLVKNPSSRTRFEREIRILEKIDSPHVAKILDHGLDNDVAWFATEFINGPDLKRLVEEDGPLSDEKWDRLARELIDGLISIHNAGIIHRDIKPSNLVLSDSGLKIVDFGIAQIEDMTSVTVSGLISGSPAWFSPEQIEGKLLTPATDLFSAGSVLTYAATGKSPWGAADEMTKAMVFGILVSEPSLTGLTERQRSVVAPLLNKDPNVRGALLGAVPDSTDKRKLTSSPPLETQDPRSSAGEATDLSSHTTEAEQLTGQSSPVRLSYRWFVAALVALVTMAGAWYVASGQSDADEVASSANESSEDDAEIVDFVSQFGEPVFSQRGLEIFFVGGQTWKLSTNELFDTWYEIQLSANVDESEINRVDCPIGSMEQLREPIDAFNVEVRDSPGGEWVTHSSVLFGDAASLECPDGTTARIHNLNLGLLKNLNRDDPCIYARFNGVQNLEYSREFEEWCIVTDPAGD